MKAGKASTDITPESDVWMDGMIRSHRSTGIHDRLAAGALAMSTDGESASTFLIVSVDVCTLDEKDTRCAREAVAGRTGVPAGHIIIAATHTHSGPATAGHFNPRETGYVEELIGKLVSISEEAVSSMRPAAAGCASGREDTISHYRRLLADDGHVVMNWEPYPAGHIVRPLGEIDAEVGVLKVAGADDPDDVICLLFNHAGHPNVMSGDNYLLSADYPGVARRVLEKEFGGAALFVNGAQGTMDIDGLRDRDWDGVERCGRALAGAAREATRAAVPSEAATVRGSSTAYALPARKITESEMRWAREVLDSTGGGLQPMADGVGDDFKAGLYMKLHEEEASPICVEQVCIAVDDSAFVSFPGELFTEIGMRIKAASPFRNTYLIGLANGSVGYIPTRKATEEGGYAVDTRRVDAGAEDIIVEKSLALLQEIHGL